MEIITATDQHIDETAVLFDAYRRFYKQAPDYEGARAFIGTRINARESVIFLALEEGSIIGFCQLYPIFSSVGMKRGWLLNDLYVLESHRGKGAGSALIDRAATLGRETSSGWLMLQTEISNTSAQALYEQKGFKRDEQSYYYYLSL